MEGKGNVEGEISKETLGAEGAERNVVNNRVLLSAFVALPSTMTLQFETGPKRRHVLESVTVAE